MAPNSLSPASVVIDYHSAFGAHRQTIPTLEWFPTNITGALGSYAPWTGSPIDAEVMVNALVNAIKPFHLPTTQFDQATVYTQATATSPNIPQRSVALTQVGTSAAGGPHKATSATFNFKTLANGNFKLVLLDAPVGLEFDPVFPADFVATVIALEAEVQNTGNAWSGRDDNRPSTLRKVTYDLNDRLQKLYHMT